MCHEDTGKGKIAITRHLSSHMEEISLAALPAGIGTDDESDSYGNDPSSISYDKRECGTCGRAVSTGVMHFCGVREDENVEGSSADSNNGTQDSIRDRWDRYEATIIKLFVDEKMTLNQVQETMIKNYNFTAG